MVGWKAARNESLRLRKPPDFLATAELAPLLLSALPLTAAASPFSACDCGKLADERK